MSVSIVCCEGRCYFPDQRRELDVDEDIGGRGMLGQWSSELALST